jgi:hypothetical protein
VVFHHVFEVPNLLSSLFWGQLLLAFKVSKLGRIDKAEQVVELLLIIYVR